MEVGIEEQQTYEPEKKLNFTLTVDDSNDGTQSSSLFIHGVPLYREVLDPSRDRACIALVNSRLLTKKRLLRSCYEPVSDLLTAPRNVYQDIQSKSPMDTQQHLVSSPLFYFCS